MLPSFTVTQIVREADVISWPLWEKTNFRPFQGEKMRISDLWHWMYVRLHYLSRMVSIVVKCSLLWVLNVCSLLNWRVQTQFGLCGSRDRLHVVKKDMSWHGWRTLMEATALATAQLTFTEFIFLNLFYVELLHFAQTVEHYWLLVEIVESSEAAVRVEWRLEPLSRGFSRGFSPFASS